MFQKIIKSWDVFEITGVRVFVIILQLIYLKIFTNALSINEVGLYYFLITISYSLNAFVLVPLDYFQQSRIYTLKDGHYSLKSFMKINDQLIKYGLIVFVIISVLSSFHSIDTTFLFVLSFSQAFFLYFNNLQRGILNNIEKRRVAAYSLLLESLLKILIFLCCVKFLAPTSKYLFFSWLISSVICSCLLFNRIKRLNEYKLTDLYRFRIDEILKFSYPISIGAAINWIQVQGYRLLLVPLGLTEIVGIYATVSNTGINGMNAYSTVFTQLFTPYLYKSKGQYIIKYLRNAAISVIFVLVCGYLLSDLIVGLLTNDGFIKYSLLLIFGIISEGGNFLIGGMTIFLTIHNATNFSIPSAVIGLLVFACSFFGLYLLEAINVYTIGFPIILSQVAVVVYMIIVVFKIFNKNRI